MKFHFREEYDDMVEETPTRIDAFVSILMIISMGLILFAFFTGALGVGLIGVLIFIFGIGYPFIYVSIKEKNKMKRRQL